MGTFKTQKDPRNLKRNIVVYDDDEIDDIYHRKTDLKIDVENKLKEIRKEREQVEQEYRSLDEKRQQVEAEYDASDDDETLYDALEEAEDAAQEVWDKINALEEVENSLEYLLDKLEY